MKLIFLDIDGVLNWRKTEDRINQFIGLCPERIARFNRIIDAHPDAKIVISSSWRNSSLFGAYEGFEGLKQLLKDRGLKGTVIGHTPIRFSHHARGSEIREYLEDHFAQNNPGETIETIEAFVILDDDTEGMKGWSTSPYAVWRDAYGEEISENEAEDLRPNHVVTTWEGDIYWDGQEVVITAEGGLQDHHIEQAIAVLNGHPLQVE